MLFKGFQRMNLEYVKSRCLSILNLNSNATTLKKTALNCPYPFQTKKHGNEQFKLENTRLDNQTCFNLMARLTSRPVLSGSYGKNEKGVMSPFFKVTHENANFNRFFYDCTHITVIGSCEHITVKGVKRKRPSYIHDLIIIDIDDFEGDWSVFKRLEMLGIQPNYIIKNPLKPQSLQVGYVLDTPVFKEKNQTYLTDNELENVYDSPVAMLDGIYWRLLEMLGGDKNFTRYNAKNPIMPSRLGDLYWAEIPEYNLAELYDNVKNAYETWEDEEIEKIKSESTLYSDFNIDFSDIRNHIQTETSRNLNYIHDENSRDCQMFDELREIAYDIADHYIETNAPEEFARYLTTRANTLNTQGLTESEIKKTVRSIVKFCFKRTTKTIYAAYNKRKQDKMSKVKDFIMQEYGIEYRFSKDDKAYIARRFEVTTQTVENYLSQLRKEHGKKDNRDQIIKEIEALRNITPPTKWKRIAELLNEPEEKIKKIYQRYCKTQGAKK